MYNRVILIGNLTRDVELRYTGTGTAVGHFGLAMNERYTAKDGTTQEKTVFVDVTVWGRQAETCGEYLKKGSMTLVEGSLVLDEWQTKDGEKRSKVAVKAQNVRFMPRGKGSKDSDEPAGQADPEDDLPF